MKQGGVKHCCSQKKLTQKWKKLLKEWLFRILQHTRYFKYIFCKIRQSFQLFRTCRSFKLLIRFVKSHFDFKVKSRKQLVFVTAEKNNMYQLSFQKITCPRGSQWWVTVSPACELCIGPAAGFTHFCWTFVGSSLLNCTSQTELDSLTWAGEQLFLRPDRLFFATGAQFLDSRSKHWKYGNKKSSKIRKF